MDGRQGVYFCLMQKKILLQGCGGCGLDKFHILHGSHVEFLQILSLVGDNRRVAEF
jgi:predicted  nucleic acid-binding Zn-ribbon protein